MAKGLFMSILVATLALPLGAARDPRPARGLRRALLLWAAFGVIWTYALMRIYPLLDK